MTRSWCLHFSNNYPIGCNYCNIYHINYNTCLNDENIEKLYCDKNFEFYNNWCKECINIYTNLFVNNYNLKFCEYCYNAYNNCKNLTNKKYKCYKKYKSCIISCKKKKIRYRRII